MPYMNSGKSKLYYEEYGDGPPLILAHGVGGNHASWFKQIPTFSKHYRTIVFDQRSFGNSDDIEGVGRSGFQDDLLRLLDELKIDKAILIGQSLGGGAVAAFSCRFPERVAALVIADSLVGAMLPPPLDQELAEVYKKAASLTQVERVLGPIIRENDPESTLLYLQIASFNNVTFKTVKGEWAPWTPAELATTRLPILILVGRDEILFTPRLMHALHKLIPNSEYCEVPAAGHSAYFENAPEFNRSVLDYLDRVLKGNAAA
ncbi:alpha/beta fold hydrolase [Bradyrhizobium mercantei]|uniref:alpha/beta fold hydrolase n=1 Tax=Bradyrhizobium mercantei TaxID=1904807 RepID=UPI000977DBEB|nr:alpha/beta hydrolase [Bradyrhizobium mercantei]